MGTEVSRKRRLGWEGHMRKALAGVTTTAVVAAMVMVAIATTVVLGLWGAIHLIRQETR